MPRRRSSAGWAPPSISRTGTLCHPMVTGPSPKRKCGVVGRSLALPARFSFSVGCAVRTIFSSTGSAPPTIFSEGRIEAQASGGKLVFTRPQGIALKNLSHKACGTDWQASLLVVSRLAGPAGRSITKAVIQIGSKLLRSPKAAALGVSLVLSALLTAAALRLPDHHWLAWISFLPLFVVVRSLRPLAALVAGGFWGGCLYLFCSTGPTPAVDTAGLAVGPSAWLLALLIVIPAVYVGLAARPARAIGFKLLTLALGWTLVEVVLVTSYSNIPEPLASARAALQNQDYSDSLHQGLLTGSQGEGPHLHWLARLLGYVTTALVVGCANASVVGILSRARLSFPDRRSLAGSPIVVGRHPSQVVMAIQSWTLRQAHPRAPPIPVAVPS